jgi:AhpD family alkylhydroperoxidase
MSRISPVNLSKLTPDMQNILTAVEVEMGFMPNDALLMAHKPDVMLAFGGLVQAVYNEQSEISQALKRLIGLVTSQAAGCRYCQAHTAHAALNHDISEEKLEALWDYETSPLSKL